MLKVKLVNNLSCPVFTCSECHEPIEDTTKGLYVWHKDEEKDEDGTDIMIFHKGKCDVLKNDPDFYFEELYQLPLYLSRPLQEGVER